MDLRLDDPDAGISDLACPLFLEELLRPEWVERWGHGFRARGRGRPEGGVGYATEARGVSREIWLARTWRLRGSAGARILPKDLRPWDTTLPPAEWSSYVPGAGVGVSAFVRVLRSLT